MRGILIDPGRRGGQAGEEGRRVPRDADPAGLSSMAIWRRIVASRAFPSRSALAAARRRYSTLLSILTVFAP